MDKEIMKLFSESVSLTELETFFITAFDNNVKDELSKLKLWKKPKPTIIYMSQDMYYIIINHFKVKKDTYREMKIEFIETTKILDFKLK